MNPIKRRDIRYEEWRRERMCGSKKHWNTGELATAAALALSWTDGQTRWAYQCEYCHDWHLTSKDPEPKTRPKRVVEIVHDWKSRLDARIDRCPGCDEWRWDRRCGQCNEPNRLVGSMQHPGNEQQMKESA